MKDFSEIIEQKKDNKTLEKKIQSTEKDETSIFIQKIKDQSVKFLSPFLLSIATGPLTTASILLQITQKATFNPTQVKIKSQPGLKNHIRNGIFGDNKIYQPPAYKGYSDVFSQLGREGIRGMYKGNLTGIIAASSNTYVRGYLYQWANKIPQFSSKSIRQNFITVATCTLADMITLPLMMTQTRLILQNSAINFRTYKSFLGVLAQTNFKKMFSGGSLLLAKNIGFTLSWAKLIPESPAYSFIISTFLSHLVIYPFLTVIRQAQCSQMNVVMMHNRSESVISCAKRLWKLGHVKMLYRGFMAYGIVHTFLSGIMIQMNFRAGFFDEIK